MATQLSAQELAETVEYMLKDFTCMALGLRVAIREHLRTSDALLPTALLPIWRDAIHNVMITYGCVCGTEQCLLVQNDEALLAQKLPKELSFDEFLATFRAGKRGIMRHVGRLSSA